MQDDAATQWVIAHGLKTYPIIDVYIFANGAMQKILPASVVYVDPDTVNVNFSTAHAGFATAAG